MYIYFYPPRTNNGKGLGEYDKGFMLYNLSFNLELGQKTKDFKTHQQTLQ